MKYTTIGQNGGAGGDSTSMVLCTGAGGSAGSLNKRYYYLMGDSYPPPPKSIERLADDLDEAIRSLSIPRLFFKIDYESDKLSYDILVPKRRINDVTNLMKELSNEVSMYIGINPGFHFKIGAIDNEWEESKENFSIGKGQGSKFIERCKKCGRKGREWYKSLIKNEWFKYLQKSEENVA